MLLNFYAHMTMSLEEGNDLNPTSFLDSLSVFLQAPSSAKGRCFAHSMEYSKSASSSIFSVLFYPFINCFFFSHFSSAWL